VTDNEAGYTGGGILNTGTLTIRRSVVSGNTSWSEEGGGIYNLGWLGMRDTRVTDNRSGWGGGGISNHGQAEITDSVIAGNRSDYGGGILNSGSMTLIRTFVRRNEAGVEGSLSAGGGIGNQGSLKLKDSTVWGNVARLTDDDGLITNGYGGGIDNSGGSVTLVRSHVIGNEATQGGAISSDHGVVALTRSLVRGNHATARGGGVWNRGGWNRVAVVWLRDSTIAGNTAGQQGGGIWNGNTWSDLLLRGSSSVTGNDPDDCFGTGAC
jgi:hypothetical protein